MPRSAFVIVAPEPASVTQKTVEQQFGIPALAYRRMARDGLFPTNWCGGPVCEVCARRRAPNERVVQVEGQKTLLPARDPSVPKGWHRPRKPRRRGPTASVSRRVTAWKAGCTLVSMKGIALKVTYNDGGAGGSLFGGFRDVCSNRNMYVNVRERRAANCSREDGPCRDFVDTGLVGRRPTSGRCYEQYLFDRQPMEFGCGMYHHGPRTGEPIPVKGVGAGDVAFLTTLLPGKQQHERVVFGCFRLAGEPELRDDWGYSLVSDGTMDVQLPDDIAVQLGFWRYFQNTDGSKKWATGLFRHLNEEQTDNLLADLLGLLGDHEERDVLLRALGEDVKPRPMTRAPTLGGSPLGGGGYAGGESEAHRKLKEYVAANPTEVGLPQQSVAEIEFAYQSGDQVDVKFDLPDGSAVVVEIETIDGWTGAHQCIKYRALLEAARGWPLGSGKVQAILVAHVFNEATLKFAKKYGIKTVTLKV